VSDRNLKGAAFKGAAAARGEMVVPAGDLDASLAFFSELGFALESTFPAEAPRVAVISGFGLRLRLDADARTPPGHLVIHCEDPRTRELTAPNGTRVELRPFAPAPQIPPLVPGYVLSKLGDAATWTVGRAGMLYRDLIPGRQGGRFIASHIRLGEGGKVADYVHFHRVRFQMLYCARGWTRLLYEDQGPAFVMEAGECVLQPPEIRHRVLECGPGTEVIEIGCPALHETVADPALALPTPVHAPRREFGGQTFLHHERAKATWEASQVPGFRARDLGIAAATRGLADARVLQSADVSADARRVHDGELLFDFVLEGSATLVCEGHPAAPLFAGDAFVIPATISFALEDRSTDLELFELAMPGPKETARADGSR
jgi:mannose-6-phosphate isomerase-like protein (cupin superfamily)